MSLLTIALLLLAAFTGMWGFTAFALAESHPTPSQTSLVGQFLFCIIAALVLLVAAFLSWFFGG